MMPGRDYPTIADETYVRSVRRAAQHLRDLADKFEREALADPTGGGRIERDPYKGQRAAAATRATQDVMWGVANMRLDGVIHNGVEADLAVVLDGQDDPAG